LKCSLCGRAGGEGLQPLEIGGRVNEGEFLEGGVSRCDGNDLLMQEEKVLLKR
jgi:hypothetical protein